MGKSLAGSSATGSMMDELTHTIQPSTAEPGLDAATGATSENNSLSTGMLDRFGSKSPAPVIDEVNPSPSLESQSNQ